MTLRVPQGWTVEPARVPFTFARAGERATYTLHGVHSVDRRPRLHASKPSRTADGREYREGYETIEYRDLEARQLYRAATTDVRGIDVETVPGLNVGYVMGVGDQVPDGIRQLGYTVTLLDEGELARGNLSRFDAIVTGTRAYAVREDLKTYNRRLLDYVEQGGNLIVLYNTQELVPNQWAPKPGELTAARGGSVGRGLAGRHPRAGRADAHLAEQDHQGRLRRLGRAARLEVLEQVGSGVSPIIATWDRGQPPQQGGWLWTQSRQGPLHLLRLRDAPPAAVRRARRVPADGESAGAGEGQVERHEDTKTRKQVDQRQKA